MKKHHSALMNIGQAPSKWISFRFSQWEKAASTMRTLAGPVTLVSALQLEKLPPMYSRPSFSVTRVRPSMPEMTPSRSARSESGIVRAVTPLCP